jgi:DNA-binding IclR family transcriptional regulator
MLEAFCYSLCLVKWSFLTNHARALICIAHDPGVRLREIAVALDVTERSAYTIVSDLIDVGYVIKDKRGNRNHYEIQEQLPLRESFGRKRTIGEILDLLTKASSPADTKPPSLV